MTRRRWIADEVSGDRAALAGEHAHHLVRVLRAQVGQQFDIATGAEVRRGTIVRVGPDRVEFHLGEIVALPAKALITVALSIFKFDRMEWAIEKATELGVARIIPVKAARTEVHLTQAAAKRCERWARIARQASEQSRRSAIAEVAEPAKLRDVLEITADVRIVLSESEEQRMLLDAIPGQAKSVAMAFGPEGGWKDEELEAFHEAGWISASLGPTILRAETAMVAAVAVCQAVLAHSQV